MKERNKSDRTVESRTRQLLEMQGFGTTSDERLAEIRPWLRVAPAATASWLLLGTLSQSPTVLWILVPFVVLGAILPTHPFDVFYNHCARYVLGQPVLPENPVQRRVCCALAGGWAMVTAILFQWGFTTAGTVTGLIATAGCALPAFTDFCVPSFVMSLMGREVLSCVPVAVDDGRRTRPWWEDEMTVPSKPETQTLYVGAHRRS